MAQAHTYRDSVTVCEGVHVALHVIMQVADPVTVRPGVRLEVEDGVGLVERLAVDE